MRHLATLLKGAPCAAQLDQQVAQAVSNLKLNNVQPLLAIVRLGQRPDDLWYERAAQKRCAAVGVQTRLVPLPEDTAQERLLEEIYKLNADPSVHGVLIFMPLPRQIDASAVCAALDPAKDVDGITEGSRAAVYAGSGAGFPPCTAEACLHILKHYGIDPAGKKAVVIGRSLVIGKPVAMLLLGKNATVTVCHSKTPDLEHVVHDADLVVAATGKIGVVGKNAFKNGQIVIDVGMNVGADGKMCGDVATDDVAAIVEAMTPVPGGVGSVTTSVLAAHTVSAAQRMHTKINGLMSDAPPFEAASGLYMEGIPWIRMWAILQKGRFCRHF